MDNMCRFAAPEGSAINEVDHSTICRWVHDYSPEIEQRTRRYLRPTNDS